MVLLIRKMTQDLPKIKRLSDVGDTPFQVVEMVEKILQGWNKKKKRTVYLFRTDDNKWGYYNKESKQIMVISAWKDKAAFVNGEWITMSLYYRLHVRFAQPVTSSSWDPDTRKKTTITLAEAIIILTDSAYKSLEEQRAGRPENSWFKLSFVTQKKKTGGSMTYANKVIWVS